MKESGKRLRALRESIGLSQTKLAPEIGSTQSSINRYENGQAAPSIELLRKYASRYFSLLPTILPVLVTILAVMLLTTGFIGLMKTTAFIFYTVLILVFALVVYLLAKDIRFLFANRNKKNNEVHEFSLISA